MRNEVKKHHMRQDIAEEKKAIIFPKNLLPRGWRGALGREWPNVHDNKYNSAAQRTKNRLKKTAVKNINESGRKEVN